MDREAATDHVVVDELVVGMMKVEAVGGEFKTKSANVGRLGEEGDVVHCDGLK